MLGIEGKIAGFLMLERAIVFWAPLIAKGVGKTCCKAQKLSVFKMQDQCKKGCAFVGGTRTEKN